MKRAWWQIYRLGVFTRLLYFMRDAMFLVMPAGSSPRPHMHELQLINTCMHCVWSSSIAIITRDEVARPNLIPWSRFGIGVGQMLFSTMSDTPTPNDGFAIVYHPKFRNCLETRVVEVQDVSRVVEVQDD
jgi:hypothetical protein